MASSLKDYTFDLSAPIAPPCGNAAPTAAGQRLQILDILRGFALLGILVLNIESFSGPSAMHDVPVGTGVPTFAGWHASLDLVIFSIKWLFFEGKMRTLFAILYGAGIVLLTERLESVEWPSRSADIFCRRNMWLLLFGLVHGTLIWEGDILFEYALLALLIMFPFRQVAASRLIGLGLAVAIVGGTVGVSRMMDAPAVLAADRLRMEGREALFHHNVPSPVQRGALRAEAERRSLAPAEIAREIQRARRPYFQSVASRTAAFFGFNVALYRSGWIFEVIGAMLLGMGLFKSGFLTAAGSRRTYVLTAAVGYGVTLPIVIVGVVMSSSSGFSQAVVTRWMFVPYSLEVVAGSIANASVLLLAFKNGWFAGPFRALANVGRTAFSNYILTSLLCQFLFDWGPWHLYGVIAYYQQIYVILAIWAINLTASALWLKAFRYGPLEWLWRSLTYWRLQPMRR